MKIGVYSHGWWRPACEALSQDIIDLPTVPPQNGNAYGADLAGRITGGTEAAAILADHPADLLLDNGGTGLGFVREGRNGSSLKPTHEAANAILCSHFVDPLVTAFQGLGWPEVWQCLQSRSWIKAVWDRAQALELARFGVPNIIHLPMAAPNRPYNTDPLDLTKVTPIVSFVGGQNTSYFASNTNVSTASLLPGTLAQAIRADLHQVSFYEAYHEIYGFAEPVKNEDDIDTQINKTVAYFNAKLFFNANQCIRNRDRFVIFLKRKLGDQFHLVGQGWDRAYGLTAATPLPTFDEYLDHFREAAININLVNGNAETGLNMRHFEITAAGGFMLCYYQPELADHFEIGLECDVFRNEQELLEKIQHYLSHPEERSAIALAGQRRTLSQHLFSHRLRTLLDGIKIQPLPVEYSKRSPMEDIKSLLPEANIVLDCGANVGQMAEGFRRIYPHANIYSFEPVTAAFDQLRERCAELNVHPVKTAVSDRNGRAMINLTASAESNSLLDFKEGNPCAQWTRVVGREEVELCTLDRWCKENGIEFEQVDLIKLDVQGAELQALYGARQLLQKVKLVYLKVSFVEIYKDNPLFEEIDGFMQECGFRRHAVYPSDQPHNRGDALYVKI